MKHINKKLLAAALAAVMALGAAAPAHAAKDTLIIANRADVNNFDPQVQVNAIESRTHYLIYDTLWRVEDGEYVPRLATEWNWADDLHLELTLREGVVYDNGNPFTADDVLFTLERGAQSSIAHLYSKIDLENTVVTDDTHMTIAFKTLDATFFPQFANVGVAAILDRETCEADPDNVGSQPHGTGPYKLGNWVIGDSVTLSASETYWGEPAKIQNLVFRFIPDATQRLIELQTGGVDFVYDMQYSDIEQLDESQITAQVGFETAVYGMFFNTHEGHKMTDENIRKALAYCIDRPQLAQGVTDGNGEAAWSAVAPNQKGYDESLEGSDPYPQDFEKAKECLAEAGYPDGITLNVLYTDFYIQKNTVEILQNWCAQGGITLAGQPADTATAISTANNRDNDWDIIVLGNGGSSNALIQLTIYDRNMGAMNAKFEDEGMYTILDEMYASSDEETQMAKAKEAQQYLSEHVGMMPVNTLYSVQAYAAALENVVKPDPGSGLVDFAQAEFVE